MYENYGGKSATYYDVVTIPIEQFVYSHNGKVTIRKYHWLHKNDFYSNIINYIIL